MGVRGLAPFLVKTCPQVINQFPNRFQCLTGRTIIIDGTLITQRLHYAPSPHPYRHVQGWYRIANDLRLHNVSAICIFDGKQRSAAKTREAIRRVQVQRLTAFRGLLERQRYNRLRRLVYLVNQPNSTIHDGPENLQSALANLYSDYRRSLSTPTAPSVPLQRSSYSATNSTPPGTPTAESSRKRFTEHPLPPITPSQRQLEIQTEEGKLWDDISHIIYRKQDSNDISKQFIPNLLQSNTPLHSAIASLLMQSSVLSNSYTHRMDLPTSQTYRMSRLVLEAMGIPCIIAGCSSIEPAESSNAQQATSIDEETTMQCVDLPVEAEALASTMVLHGYGDFVASEDTDVLAHLAPLLRNFANSSTSLTLINAPLIPPALGLSPSKFLDFCLMLGTDFTERMKNIGPITALKFIKLYGSIEEVVRREILMLPANGDTSSVPPILSSRYHPRESVSSYLARVQMARRVFTQFSNSGGRMVIDSPNDGINPTTAGIDASSGILPTLPHYPTTTRPPTLPPSVRTVIDAAYSRMGKGDEWALRAILEKCGIWMDGQGYGDPYEGAGDFGKEYWNIRARGYTDRFGEGCEGLDESGMGRSYFGDDPTVE